MEALSESRSSSLVRKYKQIALPRFGGLENPSLAGDEFHEPRANEVRVKTLAAGVSFTESLQHKCL